MALGSLAYVMNDAVIRLATEDGLGVYQVLSLRGLVMVAFFAAVASARGELPSRPDFEAPMLARVAAEVVGTVLFFAALVRMEFANAQAILQIVPLLVTLAAAFVLGERVSGRRYATIVVGLIGVIVIIRPATEGFTAWSLVVVLSVMALVVRELATNRVRPKTPALSIALVTAIANTVLTGAISIANGWAMPSGGAIALIGLAAVLLFFGYLFTIQTVRVGDLSVSAPFRYTILLGAIVSGAVLFDEPPDALTLIGGGIILATGLYAIALDRAEATAEGGGALSS